MSVLSTLALLVGAIAAKAKSVQVARPSEDRIAELEARVEELADAIARANVQYRRDQELIDLWRERALANVPALQPAPAIRLLQQEAALQQAQAHLQQIANQYLGHSGFVAWQGVGAQSLINAEAFCNCVPARHDMLLRGE